FCPYDTLGPCEHVWTGCVATAMGQIMKYYNYPSQGTGSHGFYSNYGYLEVNFGNTSYNWAEMPYNLSYDNNATATLLYHCGVSINTIYGSAGSGAYDFDARDALVDYFDYSPDAQFFERDNYILDWEVLLISELEAGRPIIYGGVGSKYYGHTFICDGYQDTAFFHFNWGWGGMYDGYFFTDSLNPGIYNFSLFQDVVVGIQPNSPPDTYPPHSLNAVVDTNSVHLSWLPPYYDDKISDLLGYNIFRDGNIVNPVIITDLFYDDLNLYPGIYEYTVKAVYIGGESEQTDPFEVEIDWIGINKIFNSEILNIYPNPASDYINIEFENTHLKKFQIVIYNLNGEVILIINENNLNSHKYYLDLSGFAQGIYYLYIQTEDKLFSRKIAVVK
ncbi:MAG: C10 family peptidase, partial [Bacteroidales bacterium]|nr:C10 family peptidase [Bacteroidales bacterium]